MLKKHLKNFQWPVAIRQQRTLVSLAYLIYKFFNSRGTVCSCNASKKPNLFNSKWPFNKLKHFFMGVKESNMLDSGLNPRGQLMTASEYANQIAEIQKQQKTKRHTSMSSDNFSSSRSDSWRQHQFLVNPNQRHHHHHHHRWENIPNTYLYYHSVLFRTDLNKRFLPKPMTTTGWKGTP